MCFDESFMSQHIKCVYHNIKINTLTLRDTFRIIILIGYQFIVD